MSGFTLFTKPVETIRVVCVVHKIGISNFGQKLSVWEKSEPRYLSDSCFVYNMKNFERNIELLIETKRLY